MDDALAIAQPASDYEARKLSEERRCTRSGCKRKAKDDSQYCAPCHRKQKKYASDWIGKRREERRELGLCVEHPGDDPPPATVGSTSCLSCRIRRRRVKISDGGVENAVERTAAIAAATSRDITGPNGRVRYRGQQKRGQQPKWQLNLQDVRHVRRDFETFEKAIKILAEPAARQMHASDRERAERETAAVGDSMTRRTGDILERLGHFPQRHGPRAGEAAAAGPDPDPEDDGTLSYKRASDAARVAAAARAGLYIYAPPLDVTSGRRETGKDPKPPDLEPLRRGLAERGLRLVDEGAFYWMIVTRDGDGE